MKIIQHLFLIVLICACGTSCTDPVIIDMEAEMEEEIVIPLADVLKANAGCPDTLSPIYLEEDGLILIEMESAEFIATQWQLDSTISGSSNNKYLVWRGSDNFNDPGNGTLRFSIRVNSIGTYQFVWRSRITEGSSQSDFNDSWLRIADAKHFYAKKDNGDIVYPKGTRQDPVPESSGQADTTPEGSGSDGWFKVYMNSLNEWRWRSATSDNDPHLIYAVFDAPGDYTVEISGRSKSHGIDIITLFKQEIGFTTATANQKLSEALCE